MTNIFKNALTLMNETLEKITLKEDDNDKFVSIKDQEDDFDETRINANIYDDNAELDIDKEQEKNKLTSQAIEKIKQNLKVSDELQSILNRIKKLNDDISTNRWEINEEDNTAILKNKNARIFKQNNNLCLSHNGIVEIFKSVPELHEWLKKNNYPLPYNITLHESTLAENEEENSDEPDERAELLTRIKDNDSALGRLKDTYEHTAWGNIIGTRWKDLGKVVDQMSPEERAEKLRQDSWNDTYNNLRKMSREEEKMARQKMGVEKIKNPHRNGEEFGTYTGLMKKGDDIIPTTYRYEKNPEKMVWNDLHSYMGDFLGDEEGYKQRIDSIKKAQASARAEKAKEEKKKAKEAAKLAQQTEALDDNQLDNEEIWYLEYQTNIPDEKSYLNSAWKEADLLSDNLDNAAKFVSREKAIDELQELYMTRKTAFPFKPISGKQFDECGVTVGGSLGSAVQYLGNKKESLDEEELDEAQRQDFKDRVALDRELIKIANIKDFDGNVIGKAGKTIKEYAANKELGFDDQKDPQGYVTYTTEDGKDIRIDDNVLNRRIALDAVTGQPMGMIDTTGKVRNLKGNKIIGYSDTREAAKNRGVDLDKLDIDSAHDDNFQFTQKAGSQWSGQNNKLGFFNPKTGEIKNKYKDAWSDLTKDNAKLRNNPEIMHTMFTDYIKDGKPVDPETFKQRVLEINDVFGLDLDANDEIIPSKMKRGSKQQQEFYKWRDNYYKNLFDVSRRKDKATHKINADKDIFSKEQDEWRATTNDRADREQSIQYFINDMQDANQKFINGEISGKELKNKFASIASNDAIPVNIKNRLADTTYKAFASYDEDMADMWKELNKQYFSQEESVLTEDDTPADFADGPTNVASDMAAATSGTDTATDTTTDAPADGLDDYGPEEPTGGAPSFGDININSGGAPEEEAPMPKPENKKIIDVLVNENDPSEIKVKVQDKETGKIELLDLDEIDV